MSAKDLKELLEHLDDTHEIVVLGPVEEPADEGPEALFFCWRDAEDEAAIAYRIWGEKPGLEPYAVYRAAADRAEAAQDALAAASARPLTRS